MDKRFQKGSLLKKLLAAVVACALVATACVAAGCSSEKTYSDSERITVQVGYWGGTCESAMFVAYEKGFFEKYGIDAEMYKITSGAAGWISDVNAITDEKGGYCVFNATPNFLPSMASGLEVKYISEVHTGCIQACATADSGITSVADLEGKNVGTFDTHDMGEIFLKAAMSNAGADYSTTTFITEGNIGTMLNAASKGEIVAFANFDPYVEICCQYFGYTKIFNNATDEGFKDQTCCFLAANKKVYEDTEVAQRIASAINDACQWITENPTEAAKVVQGDNDSGTKYVTPSAQLLEAFGVDSSKANDVDLHESLIKSYTWGNNGEDHFKASLKSQWETIDKAGMNTTGKTIDELVEMCGAYCGLK